MKEPVNTFRYDKMRELRNQGWSYEQIGKHYGISRQRAHQILTGQTGANSREVMIMKCKYPRIREYFYNNPTQSINGVCETAQRKGLYITQNQLYKILHNEPISICIQDFEAWENLFGYPMTSLFKTEEQINAEYKSW